MLTSRTRRNVSLVLFIGLLLVSAGVWSMAPEEEGMRDGTFSGSAQGFKGAVLVDVTIVDGKITAIEVDPNEETPFIAEPAIEQLVGEILAAQSTEVDVVSGATFTSEAVIKAVDQALRKASTVFADGVHTGKAEGFSSTITVEVTVSGGAIARVEVVDHDDTPFIAQGAVDQIPAAIVEAQSWDVEAVSGATLTSQGIMNAVEDALGGE
ncbi:MAG TPA: FMN-binding protein [Firmicutes bacterium]|nr:FMN-binding protein [Bacillota bacterium]